MSTLTLGQKQRLFLKLFAEWLAWALAQGYEFTWGEATRSDEQAELNAIGQVAREAVARLLDAAFPVLAIKIRNNGKNNGVRNSLHELKLAVDLNAFKGDIYLDQTEQWRELGEHWESLHELCRWGGRFSSPDGNHISLTHNGVS